MMWLRSRNTVTYLEAVTKFSRSQWLLTSCSYSDISCKKTKMAPLQERRMIDRIRLWAKAGDGGNGCSSFRRSRSDRRGKPDGGNGGRGGDVILECSSSVWDLSSVQHHINAKRGGHGAPKNMIGSRGADKIVLVPVGTVLHLLEGELPSTVEKKSSGPLDPWDIPGTLDFSSEESSQRSPIDKTSVKMEKKDEGLTPSTKPTLNRFPPSTEDSQNEPETNWFSEAQGFSEWDNFDGKTDISEPESDEEEEEEQIQYNIAELTEPGQRIIVARGGEGGSGNLESEKVYRAHKDNNTNGDDKELSDDDVAPNMGTPGTETILLLELKSIADVGLVGIPNAGKSTLLGALSRAKPIVGHYAFTTLRPNLGNLNYDDLSITVADIPGLIKGAHENRGLGHAFLRHIERTKVLAYVVDLAAGTGGRKGVPPWEQLRDLMVELEFYSEGLSSRPCLVVANKIDEVGCDEVYEELRRRVTGVPIFPVCAVLDEGIPELKDGLKLLVNGGELCGLSLESVLVD
ncbi:hypothetical protein ACP275_10G148300 [Erythranthe tilingii]